MARLEDLNRGAAVRGILPAEAITEISVQWFGSETLEARRVKPAHLAAVTTQTS